jgi:hypothetical protein
MTCRMALRLAEQTLGGGALAAHAARPPAGGGASRADAPGRSGSLLRRTETLYAPIGVTAR